MAHNCMATGCPLAGTLSRSTTGGDDYMCRFHYRGDPNDWPKITERLSHESKLINRIHKLIKTPTVQLDENGKPAFRQLQESLDEIQKKINNA